MYGKGGFVPLETTRNDASRGVRRFVDAEAGGPRVLSVVARDLNSNKLTGTIPAELGKLSKLYHL